MNRDNFKWTDELVKEFHEYALGKFSACHPLSDRIERFKASHTSAIEEREGRDWEVECFTDGSRNWWRQPNGLYTNQLFERGLSEDALIENKKIWAVRRKSDGVIFSIGDEFDLFGGMDRRYKIDGFLINGSVLYAIQSNYPDCERKVSLPHLIKLQPLPKRTKLFTTTDNKDAHIGDVIYYLREWDICSWEISHSMDIPDESLKTFTTEAAAKEYITLNKPVLSVNDLTTLFPNLYHDDLLKIKDLAKKKLNIDQ